jgi:hypothetical protein
MTGFIAMTLLLPPNDVRRDELSPAAIVGPSGPACTVAGRVGAGDVVAVRAVRRPCHVCLDAKWQGQYHPRAVDRGVIPAGRSKSGGWKE